MTCPANVGWMDATNQACSGDTCITLTKLEGGSEGSPLRIAHTFSVSHDFSWEIIANGKKLPSTCDLLSTMPQSVSSVQDVFHVIGFLNSLVPCHGNK